MKITINEIANLFDEIDEDYLTPFDWNPNTKLPNGGRTYRLKDRFKVRFRNMECIFDDIELCRIKFHSIFFDNIHYVYQCHELIEKIKKLADSDRYDYISNKQQNNIGNVQGTSTTGNSMSTLAITDGKGGGILGSADMAQFSSMYNREHKIVEFKNLLDKKEDAIMQVLDPNARSIEQSYNRSIDTSGGLNQSTSSTLSTTGTTNKFIGSTRMGVEAHNELKALTISVPRLVAEFLECFIALFYY